MFGHMERQLHWRPTSALRALQAETGGFTESCHCRSHMQAPIYRTGDARRGRRPRVCAQPRWASPSTRSPKLQTSWVKMGPEGIKACLQAGVNDLGGTLMNESISRAAGSTHGQEMTPAMMEEVIHSIGRTPRKRTTLYA